MTPVTSRKWECAVIGTILFIASYLLFVPPIVGVADDGDYVRMAAHAGIDAPAGLPFHERYLCWVIPRWNVVPPANYPYFMVGEFTAWIAVKLSRGTGMDIRWIGGVHLALLLAVILAIGRGARKLPTPAYAVIGIGLVLVCTDSEYISYFNSLYGEGGASLECWP